ncbi:MAG: hypothetical protein LBD48_07370 [Treponema sp.]|nr:hypothetical protein [Treponema sp.]
MKTKRCLFVALIAVLVYGAFFMACQTGVNGGGAEPDIWSSVSDFGQLNGTWKGAYAGSKTVKQYLEELGMLDAILDSVTEDAPYDKEFIKMALDNIILAINAQLTMTIDTAAKTRAQTVTATVKFSGQLVDFAWPFIAEELEKQYGGVNNDFVIDAQNKTMSTTQSSGPDPITEVEIAKMMSAVQVNQNGAKIKLPGSPANPATGMPAIPEIIFVKQ